MPRHIESNLVDRQMAETSFSRLSLPSNFLDEENVYTIVNS